MTGSPLTHIGRLFAAIPAATRQSASMAFKPASKIVLSVVALMATTLSAVNLPFDEAIAFLRQKTAVTTNSWRDVWDGAHSKSFMVAGANKMALVKGFQSEILKAIEDGTTLEAFRDGFDGLVKKHGWSYKGERGWRTQTIFETNLNTAYAAGRYAQMTAPETLQAFPFWQYNHSGALHPRVNHKEWDDKVYAADDPFWKTNYPPNGFRCGCFVTPVSGPQLKRLKKSGPDQSPNLDQLGTDQPLGVDPSFAYNPGAAWLAQTAPGPVAVSASQMQVAAFANSALRGKWPDGSWTPVALADRKVGKALDVAAGTEIRLTAETIRNEMESAVATPDTYGVIPGHLAKKGKLLKDKAGNWSFVGDHDGTLYQASIRVTETDGRRQIYMNRLARTDATRIRKDFGLDWK